MCGDMVRGCEMILSGKTHLIVCGYKLDGCNAVIKFAGIMSVQGCNILYTVCHEYWIGVYVFLGMNA